MRPARLLGVRRSQFLGLGILACIGAGHIHVGWLSAAIAAVGIASTVLGFSGLFAIDRERSRKGVPTKP